MISKPETENESFQSGFTSRSILASIYAIAVFTPAIMYLQLVTGQTGFSVAWFTLLLWSKLLEMSGNKLLRQEALIVFLLSGLEFIPLSLIYRAWYRQSEIAILFKLVYEIPDWYAPPPITRIIEFRTFLHSSWIPVLSLLAISSILNQILAFSLALIAREILIESENLPFPIQQANAVALVTVTEGEPFSTRILSVFATFGFIYGFFLYALPFVIQSWSGQLIYFLPIPWIDLNKQIEISMPGALFGLATDIIPYASGIIIPFKAAISLGIASLAVFFFGNWLVVKYNLSPTPWWTPGMNIQLASQQSILYFWATILIGFALSAGIGPILKHPKFFTSSLQHLINPTPQKSLRRTDPINFRIWILLPLIISLVGHLALSIILVPNFILSNLWFIPFMIFLPFISTLTAGRMLGEVGTATFPSGNFQNILYLASGYPRADIWFFPSPATTSGHGYLTWFKIAEITKTDAKSLIKAFWFVWPVSFILGIVYLQILWSLGPIPSARYPGVQIYWPIDATFQSLWIKGREVGMFPVSWVFFSFVVGLLIFFLIDLLHLPISFAALAAGSGTLPPYGIAYVLGAIVSLVIEKIIGKEFWRKNKLLIAAGLMMGESIAITISVAVSLIINSIWMQAY